ncbi:MAG: GWxTD domain-containing protein [Acidobacteriota bacterium]
MKNILLFCLIILGTITQAQPSRQGLNQMRGIFFDTIVIPSGNNSNCYIAYQTTCNRLVFVKDKDVFKTHFSLSIEVVDSLSGKVYREITDNEYSVKDFEETNSENKYVQGVLKLSLPSGSYKVVPVIYDYNTSSEHVLSQFDLKVTPPELNWALSPIVLKETLPGSNGAQKRVLAGFDGNVPFSHEDYDMVIPVADTNVSSVFVELKNNDSLIFKDSIKNSFVASLSFSPDKENIAAEYNSHGTLTRNFVLPKFNEKLQEGVLSISLENGKKGKTFFRRSVTWYNKPRSLNNLEYAVKVLKNIDGDNESQKKDKAQNKMDYPQLLNYWKKFDPTPQTAYNELMAEFYRRVDYAAMSFSLISNPDGADTDRGRIYIKFGKPKSVERIYTGSKDVQEVWVYEEPNRQFIFVDKSGLGNFILNGKL